MGRKKKVDIIENESTDEVLGPSSAKQEMFLRSEAQITIYGGAMGGGKTFMGILRHLLYVDDPYYIGYIVRKNKTTLMKAGGVFQEASEVFKKYDPRVKINKVNMTFTFPSGAVVALAHYDQDTDSEKWRGLQVSGIMVDEGNQLKEDHILVMNGRLRTKAQMIPNMWITTNPDPDSYVRKWIDWWIYPKDHALAGRPIPERDGVIRWFYALAGVMYWSDTPDELLEKFGSRDQNGDLYPRSDKEHQHCQPISVTFISATIFDNPKLLKANPNYLSTLQALPRVRKERDLFGNWDVREEKSTFFNREWVKEVFTEPPHTDILKTVRAYDFAGTLKSETENSPDYTACVKMSKLRDGSYFIHDVQRIRIRFGEWENFVLRNAYKDGTNTTVVLPVDPSNAAKEHINKFAIKIIEHGYIVHKRRASMAKLDRFRPVSALAMNGNISILNNCGTDYENNIYNDLNFFYLELENFTGQRRNCEIGHDDRQTCRQ